MKKNRVSIICMLFCILSLSTSCIPFVTKTVTIYNPTDLPVQVSSSNLYDCDDVMIEAYGSKTFNVLNTVTSVTVLGNGAHFYFTNDTYSLNFRGNTAITLEPNCAFFIINNQTGYQLYCVKCGDEFATYNPEAALTNNEWLIKNGERRGAKFTKKQESFILSFTVRYDSYRSVNEYTTPTSKYRSEEITLTKSDIYKK